jgi:hypothetical protein
MPVSDRSLGKLKALLQFSNFMGPFCSPLSNRKMINGEVRELIVSQFLDGREFSEIFSSLNSKCTKGVVYRVVAEFQNETSEKVDREKEAASTQSYCLYGAFHGIPVNHQESS